MPIALGALVATWGVVTAPWQPDCGVEAPRSHGECLITDGRYVFDPALQDVQAKIEAENQAVEEAGDFVTLAVSMPFRSSDAGAVSLTRMRSVLEGAYVAQRMANDDDARPRIRLVLANQGEGQQDWKATAEALAGLAEGDDHLVGVVGLGVSSRRTADAARILSDKGIAMVGSVITADTLNSDGEGLGGRIPGLTRVNTIVRDQLAVISEYLKRHRPRLRTAILVNDSNPDDLYTAALASDFSDPARPLAAHWRRGGEITQPYDGESRSVRAQFEAIISNLCGVQSPDVIFYAGRARLLPDFVTRLRQRTCITDRAVTVVTGSDASALRTTLSRPGEHDKPVSVLYVPLADPSVLAQESNPDLAQFVRFQKAFEQTHHFPDEDLDDGWAIMTYDAVLAADKAIKRAASPDAERLPMPEDVRSQLYTMNSPTTSVPGAGGTFWFDSTSGDVRNRRLPVVELQPNGEIRVLGVFDQPG